MPADVSPASMEHPHTLGRRAEEARESGRWDDAIVAASAAIRLAPDSVGGWTELAFAHLARQEDAASLAAAQRAVECDVACSAARRVLALALLRHRDVARAEEEATAALRLSPHYPEGVATLALIRMVRGQFREADALFRHALALKDGMAEAIGNHAALLARLGNDREALDAADRAIALKPFLPAAHTLRGTLLHRAGHFSDAAASFALALATAPATADLHARHSDALRLAGRTGEAIAAARAGLGNHPGDPTLLANLGTALQTDGQPDAAITLYRRALADAPALAEVENNIGRLHLDAGHPDRARLHLRRAFALGSNVPTVAADIARGLAQLLLDQDRAEEALHAARAAADLVPRDPAGLVLLARAQACLRRGEDAETTFTAALRLDPARIETWFQAGATLLQTGRRAAAVGALRQLCRLAPGNPRHWALLGQALRRVRFSAADDGLRADLLAALAQPGTERSHLVDAVTSVAALTPAMAALLNSVSHAPASPLDTLLDTTVRERLVDGSLKGLATDRLLLALLDGCLLTDPRLEAALTALRRAFLMDGANAALDDPAWLPFLCALAGQCFLNEYVFAESDAESAEVAALGARLDALSTAGETLDPASVALLAAYRPLHRWAGVSALRGPATPERWPDCVALMLARQVEEPLAEEALKAGLPRLTEVKDAVSEIVRTQYEENPYPRWSHLGLLAEPMPVPAIMRAMFPRLTPAIDPSPQWDRPEILVAGCGTGREAAWAVNHVKGARVLAVDLSLTSLAHAARQAHRLNLEIAFAQADILELGAAFATTGQRFDLIQCVGVLHHMEDPVAGLRVLHGLLRPHGLMKIGLYSERARQPVVAARDFIAERGYESSTVGIRRFRQDALTLPDAHPVKPVTRSPDFFSTSACRDLAFHAREHRCTLPRIAGWLDALGLEFLGFQLEDPTVATLYRERFPEDGAMIDLDLWDRFEADHPHVFGELYQFWVRPKAAPAGLWMRS